MVLGERWVLKRHFDGLPKASDFELVKEELEPLKENELYFESEFISVDPYQRYFSGSLTPPCTMFGSVVAKVTESRAKGFSKGNLIVAYCGWVKVGKLDTSADGVAGIPGVTKVPSLGMSSSHHLGACGMPGVTAHRGLLDLCQPKKGETVFVNAAAGAVGSLVGQIAKIKGCRVVGTAGSDDKVRWLKEELGFDAAFNYKKVGISDVLKRGAPDGIDCFFENVGGEDSTEIMMAMNNFGRVAICGIISAYNAQGEPEKTSSTHRPILVKQLRVEGLLVARWRGEAWDESARELAAWIRDGKIKAKETIVEGFDKTPEAFAGLFSGDNTGKMVVKC